MSLTSPFFVRFRCFFFLSHCLPFDWMYLLSSDESDSLDDESEDDGYDSGSSCTYFFYAFSLRFDDSVNSVSGLGYVVFVPKVVDSKCDIFVFDVFVPI